MWPEMKMLPHHRFHQAIRIAGQSRPSVVEDVRPQERDRVLQLGQYVLLCRSNPLAAARPSLSLPWL
jgi:hypothetical protein